MRSNKTQETHKVSVQHCSFHFITAKEYTDTIILLHGGESFRHSDFLPLLVDFDQRIHWRKVYVVCNVRNASQ